MSLVHNHGKVVVVINRGPDIYSIQRRFFGFFLDIPNSIRKYGGRILLEGLEESKKRA